MLRRVKYFTDHLNMDDFSSLQFSDVSRMLRLNSVLCLCLLCNLPQELYKCIVYCLSFYYLKEIQFCLTFYIRVVVLVVLSCALCCRLIIVMFLRSVLIPSKIFVASCFGGVK